MSYIIKQNISKIAGKLGYKIEKKGSDPFFSDCKDIFDKCRKFTMTSSERMFALHKAVEYVVNSKILGDFVECGVWKGGSAMVIAHTLVKMGVTDRKIWLYDTFEGMSEPSEEDVAIRDGSKAINTWMKKKKGDHSEWDSASLSSVQQNMFSTSYPQENLIFVKGKIEDTIPKNMPSQIALLRLDTDWYESTKHELNYLYPLLVNRGVLIIDDYGFWAGARKAVDEYFSRNNLSILINRIDSAGRVGVKIS